MITATDTLDEAACYEEVRDLVYHQANKFHAIFGGDFDEIESGANMAWLKGHRQFAGGMRPSGEVLDTAYHIEIRRWVWFELFDAMRTRAARATRGVLPEACGEAAYDFADTSFDDDLFARELGDDAAYVLRTVLEPPLCVMVKSQRKGGEPRNLRSTVRAWLRDCGWGTARINEAFEEIREELRCR
jgi:hypothetical protein